MSRQMSYSHIDLFTGIGGWSLAARWLNLNTIAQVENDEYCQEKLNKNFPDVPKYRDIVDYQPLATDIITASPPCQPFSIAGKKLGSADSRNLWHEVIRILDISKPSLFCMENVPNITKIENGAYFEQLVKSLRGLGYTTEAYIIPATSVRAIHKRARLWLISYTQGNRWSAPRYNHPQTWSNFTLVSKAPSVGLQRRLSEWSSRGAAYGLPGGMAVKPMDRLELSLVNPMKGDRTKDNRNAIKAYGNAIVPQIAYSILKYGLETISSHF